MGIHGVKQKIKGMLPPGLVAFLYAAKLSLKKLPAHRVYEECLEHKSGIEVGGPSIIFRTVLPLYRVVSHLDGVNFSNMTMWEGSLKQGGGVSLWPSSERSAVCRRGDRSPYDSIR